MTDDELDAISDVGVLLVAVHRGRKIEAAAREFNASLEGLDIIFQWRWVEAQRALVAALKEGSDD